VTATQVSTAVADVLSPPGMSCTPGGTLASEVGAEAKAAAQVSKVSAIVLGRFPEYLTVGEKIGAKTFNIPKEIWSRMTPGQQWAANVKFLDRAIARGDDIVLSNPVRNLESVSGTLRKELDYLVQKGYSLSDDGKHMIR
jgi:hypothetical protein